GRAADGALVDLDDLVYVLDARDPLVGSGRGLGAVQRLRQRRPEDGVDEGRLAGPRRAGHAGERAERDADVDVLEVVLARALDDEALAVALTAAGRHGDLLVATQVRGRQRALVSHQLVGRAERDDLAAVHARAWAQVDDVVGRAHRLLVVLDDDERVTEVAQVVKRAKQALVVARVQADRRLVQDVEHTG